MKGFKVLWANGDRKVAKVYSICGLYIKLQIQLKHNGMLLEVYRTLPLKVARFLKVAVRKGNFAAASTNAVICPKREGIYLNGEKIGEYIFPKENFIEAFLNGRSVHVVSVGSSLHIISFPGGRVKNVEVDSFMEIAMDILGKKEVAEIAMEVAAL